MLPPVREPLGCLNSTADSRVGGGAMMMGGVIGGAVGHHHAEAARAAAPTSVLTYGKDGKVKLVMRAHQLFVECRGKPEVLAELLRDPELAQWRPLLRLERMQLRVRGRVTKTFSGTLRFQRGKIMRHTTTR